MFLFTNPNLPEAHCNIKGFSIVPCLEYSTPPSPELVSTPLLLAACVKSLWT